MKPNPLTRVARRQPREDPMWFEIWAVTIALAIGCVVAAQIIERQGDAVRGS
jgi:hypothetical protein